MSKKIQTSVVVSARVISTLIELAREWKNGNLTERVSSTLIYANTAEFVGEDMLKRIPKVINADLSNGLFRNKIKKNKKKIPTNLNYTVSQLEQYQFPKDVEIIGLLKQIRDSRNNVFHNFITAHEKGINPDSEMRKIEKNVENLLSLWIDFNKNLF